MATLTRRRFLQYGAAGGAALMLPARFASLARAATPALLDPLTQPKFVNPLPNPLVDAFQFAPTVESGHDAYQIGMAQIEQELGLVDPVTGARLATPVWGYTGAAKAGGLPATTYPGRTFVVQRDREVRVHWTSDLPKEHLLPVDTTLHWAFSHFHEASIDRDGVPVVAHVHGGHTEYASDGLPEFWFTSTGLHGPQYEKQVYTYDNDQEAGTVWYHDHALGITRLNVYAGLAGFFLIRDANDTGTADNPLGLPAYPYEVPIVIQDRLFTADGRLYFPADPPTRTAPDPSVLAEFFGDTILVNGVVWPRMAVEPRQYRLRLLNGSDSAFYSLQLKPQGAGRPADIVQIGTDGGFLHQPVPLNGALVLAPGERADVLVDFSAYPGRRLVMTSNAPQPFPFGVAAAPTATQIMAFDVASTTPRPGALPSALRDGPWSVGGEPAKTRKLLLFEGTDDFGRIFAQLGTVDGGRQKWDDAVTETVDNDSVEIWEVFNTTPDAHPIHLHLPQFEVLDRAPFRASQDRQTGALRNIRVGPAVPAPPQERGPKDTAQMFPGEVTRIKARFDRRGEYVWHCHILSHEDHEMMRRYSIE